MKSSSTSLKMREVEEDSVLTDIHGDDTLGEYRAVNHDDCAEPMYY